MHKNNRMSKDSVGCAKKRNLFDLLSVIKVLIEKKVIRRGSFDVMTDDDTRRCNRNRGHCKLSIAIKHCATLSDAKSEQNAIVLDAPGWRIENAVSRNFVFAATIYQRYFSWACSKWFRKHTASKKARSAKTSVPWPKASVCAGCLLNFASGVKDFALNLRRASSYKRKIFHFRNKNVLSFEQNPYSHPHSLCQTLVGLTLFICHESKARAYEWNLFVCRFVLEAIEFENLLLT